MIVAILADNEIKAEITSKGYSDAVEIIWADSIQSLRIIEADAYFDLMFEKEKERIERLKFLLPKPIFVNAVITTGKELPEGFVRVNAWHTMIGRNIIEVASIDNDNREEVKEVFDQLGWAYQEVPDIAGMI